MNTVIKGTKTIAEYKRVREDMEKRNREYFKDHIGTEPNYKELAGRKGQVGYLQRQGEKRTAKQN